MKICSWRFFLWNIYFGDWTFEEKFNEDLFMEISPWRFILEIFPLKFWKFLLKICSLEIFPLEYGFGDFSFEKWRIFLLKMEIYLFIFIYYFLWSQSEEDEDRLEMMKIYSWWFFFFFLKNLSFEWEQLWLEVNVDCWISPWLNSCKKILSISNRFIHWNELEVLTQCP